MIAVIADDFSGAAELAGIAAARGLRAEVQTRFDPRSEAEVIAVDTDTRLKSEEEAARIVHAVAGQIAACRPAWIYKKTDSILRGHVRAEIEALLQATGLARCLLIPANPSKDRVIRGGRYFIGGVPLHQTVFAQDPDHPRATSVVRELLGDSPRIETPDVESAEDLERKPDAATLAAGASDYFGWLLGGRECQPVREPVAATLLICGSLAAWDMGRVEQMQMLGFSVVTHGEELPDDIWQRTRRLMLAIGRPAGADEESLLQALTERAVKAATGVHGLRIALEGGATALAFIQRMGWSRFEALPEGLTGVGSLRPPGGPLLWIKPGSYPWPEGVFREGSI